MINPDRTASTGAPAQQQAQQQSLPALMSDVGPKTSSSRVHFLYFLSSFLLLKTALSAQVRWVLVSRQQPAGSGQWAVGSRQWAVGSRQWAVGNGQWEVGRGQQAVASLREYLGKEYLGKEYLGKEYLGEEYSAVMINAAARAFCAGRDGQCGRAGCV